ncbi:MAG TPA: hypothetical protein PLD30_10205 [Candidatus Competibacteraceae bacterium]|nr:hypothetical protein [Candidatus Competibacteraceae bacterium]
MPTDKTGTGLDTSKKPDPALAMRTRRTALLLGALALTFYLGIIVIMGLQ